MEIRKYKNYNENEILNLYSSVGWRAYTDDPVSLKAGFENSLLTLAAYEDDTLLGLIRTVGDGQTIVYIQDILVLPEYQRKGIGVACEPLCAAFEGKPRKHPQGSFRANKPRVSRCRPWAKNKQEKGAAPARAPLRLQMPAVRVFLKWDTVAGIYNRYRLVLGDAKS